MEGASQPPRRGRPGGGSLQGRPEGGSQPPAAHYKLWLEIGDGTFGEGLCRLLRLVEGLGSIQAAARRLRMSYREAWGRIKGAERRMGLPLLETRAGGQAGGGAWPTAAARDLMDRYEQLRVELDEAVAAAGARHFRGWPG